MARELELKTVVRDPAVLLGALQEAGAIRRFHGMMRDRRLDRDGALGARDEVLRVRFWTARDGTSGPAEVTLKGPTGVSPGGYKEREETTLQVDDGEAALRILGALGYRAAQAIDRYVEVYEMQDTMVRLEWYPRMDVLLEIEGTPDGIEQAIAALGLSRADCLADPLFLFAERYQVRTGRPAILAEADLAGEPPGWSHA